jgi:hypothetical protein
LRALTLVTLVAEGGRTPFSSSSGSYMVTGANTNIKLINGALAKNVLFATTAATTTGAGSKLGGSILADRHHARLRVRK